ncbi:sensor histidine kinase [Propioniciclava soli]|uniref:sensor histidine kinase n=1 Tax=Propioniciclava soli TaxID=2775081 RepID=UPI001E3DED19|nr:sensor histidine kinase [Propioniciclava soli]
MAARAWVGTAARAAASALVLLAGWRFAGLAGTPGDAPPWSTGGLPIEAKPLTPLVAATVTIIVAGLLVARVRPRLGYGLTLLGMVAHGLAGGDAPALVLPGMFVAVGLVHHLPPRRLWLWLLALPVALWSPAWNQAWLGLTDLRVVWSVVTTTTLTLVPAAFAALRMARLRAAAAARAGELQRAAHEERLRVVHDIHDIVGHSLSMISLQSAVALRVLDTDPAQARLSLEAIRGSSRDALAELRAALDVFRTADAVLTPAPTLDTIASLVADVRAGGVRVELDPVPDASGLTAAVQTVAHRVVQESLTNAIRHAPGSAVRVTLTRGAGALRVTVANDRAAGAITEGGGLSGMRSRVEAVGGRLAVTPGPDRFCLTATLPDPTPFPSPSPEEP